jgi:hypothetical protein
MNDKLKSLANGIATARHTVAIVLIAAAGVVSGTLLYAQVSATEKKSSDNETKIEAIQRSLSGIDTKQQVIIQQIKGEKQNNEEFRDRTDRSLDRILDRLTPRDRPIR